MSVHCAVYLYIDAASFAGPSVRSLVRLLARPRRLILATTMQ